jgi:hypothetical protein
VLALARSQVEHAVHHREQGLAGPPRAVSLAHPRFRRRVEHEQGGGQRHCARRHGHDARRPREPRRRQVHRRARGVQPHDQRGREEEARVVVAVHHRAFETERERDVEQPRPGLGALGWNQREQEHEPAHRR